MLWSVRKGKIGARDLKPGCVRQDLGGMMRVTGIVANLPVADIAAARDFYTGYLGLNVEGFNLGWVANFRSPRARRPSSSSPATRRRLMIRSSRGTSAPALMRRTPRRNGVGTRSFTH